MSLVVACERIRERGEANPDGRGSCMVHYFCGLLHVWARAQPRTGEMAKAARLFSHRGSWIALSHDENDQRTGHLAEKYAWGRSNPFRFSFRA